MQALFLVDARVICRGEIGRPFPGTRPRGDQQERREQNSDKIGDAAWIDPDREKGKADSTNLKHLDAYSQPSPISLLLSENGGELRSRGMGLERGLPKTGESSREIRPIVSVGIVADEHHRSVGEVGVRLSILNQVEAVRAVAVEDSVHEDQVIRMQLDLMLRFPRDRRPRSRSRQFALKEAGDGAVIHGALPHAENSSAYA